MKIGRGLGSVVRYFAGNGGSLAFGVASESHTLSAATRSATANIIPANAMVLGVALRVTTAVTASAGTTFDVWVTGSTTRYAQGVAFASGTTATSGGDDERIVAPATTSLTFECGGGGAFTAGVVRIQVYYLTLTAPTS